MSELATLVPFDLKMRAVRIEDPDPGAWDQPHFTWRCTLQWHEKRFEVVYRMGVGHVDKAGVAKRPELLQVLDCLLSDSDGLDDGFEFWAGNLGYDVDSRKAYRIYEACVDQRARLQAFLGTRYEACLRAERL